MFSGPGLTSLKSLQSQLKLMIYKIVVIKDIPMSSFAEAHNRRHHTLLLLHQPLHSVHIRVVTCLAQFLQQHCNVDVLLDIRDIPQTEHKVRTALSSAAKCKCCKGGQSPIDNIIRRGIKNFNRCI
jgi:hypothetical protein